VKHLVALGVRLDLAIKQAVSRKKYWRMCRTPGLHYAMPSQWLEQQEFCVAKFVEHFIL
jgi:hypothetical protein